MTAEVKTRKRKSAPERPGGPPPAMLADERASVLSDHGPAAPERGPRRAVSPLTLRILAVNALALGILVGGLLYLGEYQRSLVDAKMEALSTQGRIFAGALGESAVASQRGGIPQLDEEMARQVVRRLVAETRTRARLYNADGMLVIDSRSLAVPGGLVQEEELPPPRAGNRFGDAVIDAYDWVVNSLPATDDLPPYVESAEQRASDYPEALAALAGDAAGAVRRTEHGRMVLSYAVPVQRLKKVTGALLMSVGSAEIDADLRAVRLDILKIFGIAFCVTVLMSFYLAGAIARPIRRLAAAAERVRWGHGRQIDIPDFTHRQDEIGDLSGALRQMTEELWLRMEAVERFAADVAHEIKNPLTSMRSAIETAAKVSDPERQRQLMAVILDDVERLDRLISDISRASRLDAELSRSQFERVDIGHMVRALAEVHNATAGRDAPRLEVRFTGRGDQMIVEGIEDRLVQVLQNVVGNAISFSPAGGVITLSAGREGDFVTVIVEDQGPGIPEAMLSAIFGRFYSERPAGEKFGTHSGLGLSISRQIVEVHGGSIHAENVYGRDGEIRGARFVIRLPKV